MLRAYISLVRPKHYIKNTLIFVPLIFSGQLFVSSNLIDTLLATIVFSLLASVVYIVNDIRDISRDREHPKKKNRPLASGALSVSQAVVLAVCISLISAAIIVLSGMNIIAISLLAVYLIINLGYSFGLKNIPIVDVAILAAGFVIRVLYGASVVDIDVSNWLYLTVLAGAFYVSLGKRRNEMIINGAKSRKVNEAYTLVFLDKFMYVCLGLLLVFYSLWATDPASGKGELFFWTIPIVMLIFMTYSLQIEKKGSLGDPVDILFGAKALPILGLVYVTTVVTVLYLW